MSTDHPLPAPVPPSGRDRVDYLQGGLPPVPYRAPTARWTDASPACGHEPFQSRAIKREVLSSHKEWTVIADDSKPWIEEQRAKRERAQRSWL